MLSELGGCLCCTFHVHCRSSFSLKGECLQKRNTIHVLKYYHSGAALGLKWPFLKWIPASIITPPPSHTHTHRECTHTHWHTRSHCVHMQMKNSRLANTRTRVARMQILWVTSALPAAGENQEGRGDPAAQPSTLSALFTPLFVCFFSPPLTAHPSFVFPPPSLSSQSTKRGQTGGKRCPATPSPAAPWTSAHGAPSLAMTAWSRCPSTGRWLTLRPAWSTS